MHRSNSHDLFVLGNKRRLRHCLTFPLKGDCVKESDIEVLNLSKKDKNVDKNVSSPIRFGNAF